MISSWHLPYGYGCRSKLIYRFIYRSYPDQFCIPFHSFRFSELELRRPEWVWLLPFAERLHGWQESDPLTTTFRWAASPYQIALNESTP